MRMTDALGIGGDCQKRKDRRDPDHLKEGLRKREQKNRAQLRSTVWSRQKENAANQIENVMNKPGQGGSELHVEEKWAHGVLQRARFPNYLRENSRVKDYRATDYRLPALNVILSQAKNLRSLLTPPA